MIDQRASSHRELILSLLAERGIARLSELTANGVTATSVSRLVEDGSILQLGRGLYQLPDTPLDLHHALAEVSKLVPRSVICLVSALSYYELTDQIPRTIWIAIGPKDWRPRLTNPPLRIVRFSKENLTRHVDCVQIEGVEVRMTSPARTIVDLFRYRAKVGQNVALEGLKEALRTRKATPAEIQSIAAEMKQGQIIRPYLEALSFNG